MFNENSQMPDLPQGTDETGATVLRPAIGTDQIPDAQPSVTAPAGPTALAWWNSMKYFWKKSAAGGFHLAPLEDYIVDVLDRGDHYINLASNELSEDDLKAFDAYVTIKRNEKQELDAMFQAGGEGLSVLRNILTRAIIARKIAGASAVSAEHRVINERSREGGDVEKMQSDANGFYASDVEKRTRWAEIACLYEYAAAQLADGEVIPTDSKAFAELFAKRISRDVYTDSVEQGNRLKRPAPGTTSTDKRPSREELLALTA